jgi:hypothetical protein
LSASTTAELKEVDIWWKGATKKQAAIFGGVEGGFENGIVLEVVLTHLFVAIVPAQTFDARIGKVLTGVKEFGVALAANR